MEFDEPLVNEARSLVQRTLQDYDDRYGFGTMSCAAYDTAWVSLVTKTVDGRKQWLFPECFEFLLETQSDAGGWEIGNSAPIDGILNTAASLLALKRHVQTEQIIQPQHNHKDLAGRAERAAASLRAQLAALDVSTTEHVGFEIIVPAMLDLLEAEDPSLVFEFPARKPLMKIHDAKMSRFRPEYLYGKQPMTALHSLEAFIGKIDFDKVRHHRTHGSMMGSPSSTAAYLMHASQWDDESEAYLRHVIKHAAGQGTGAVPSAFPSTHFESSWILTTLFRAGFSASHLACDELNKLVEILEGSFEKEGGAIGYAPGFQADVDDTAKTISTLAVLGRDATPRQMIKVFEANTHFRTYPGERDPSLTANCNALSALLHQPDAAMYGSQIQKITKFVCDYWWKSDGKIKDKWNTCYLYPSVLLVEVLVDLVSLLEQGKLPDVLDQELQYRVAITLFQACLRPLLDQDADGSWNKSIEATAYGILILTEARRVCFFDRLSEPLNEAIRRGIAFADSMSGNEAQLNYIWIEKVSYASALLTKSYLLAARWAAKSPLGASVGSSLWTPPREGLDKHVRLFHQAELFRSLPEWELRASMIEAALFTPLLRAHRLDVFPRQDVGEDKYLDVVPFFWTAANNRDRTYASTLFLYDMCFIAMLNFQLDEFMEATAGILFRDHMDDLRQLIHDLLAEKTSAKSSAGSSQGTKDADSGIEEDVFMSDSASDSQDRSPEYDLVFSALSTFTKHVLQHPSIQSASVWDRKLLAREMKAYLLAHIQQAEDSTPLSEHKDVPQKASVTRVSTSTTTFFNWVRTTSADHISCPYSFHFVACHLGAALSPKGSNGDCYPSAGEKFLAAAVCRHLATMCRMYNDLGSAERDSDEGNLNSLDFPEFADPAGNGGIEIQKAALLRLAEFERDSYLEAFRRLQDESNRVHGPAGGDEARLSRRRMAILEFFAQQVDLYGQVYVIRDISARIPKNEVEKKRKLDDAFN
ncbi:Copalyl diphosphate synthase [Diaporthe amygdali]|uniref:Copalyl diphosphate synthase n=1 Tax=Phomopsis amygdali TaxID=1214568 RepID=UPI0022FE021A|nr:Copalyl diphosphate synthase [Diaporthe amygdali]KAJ0109430.1 Copalyl diphosphate synthase [Diaporthe amygdali]